ncbi:tetratricopeptide repeat protein [Nonomuraea sp. C10]|nr:tetratricopeptide repeat protein [Nonomuraea sp. C10]
MLRRPQADADRIELRRLAAWLSALVGNTAFHTADHAAASIHFGTAARLGTAVGDHDLICWTLGAQSMTACSQGKPQQAVELAAEALEYARTPLRRAQIIAWGLLRATAALGPSHRSEAERMMAAAQNEMAADPHGDQPGRFGFDAAELLLHLAESALLIGAQDQAVTHAQASQQHSRHGGAGWAAALIVQARAEAARRQYSYATALAGQVLDAVPAQSLRNTTRVRLRALDQKLLSVGDAGIETRDLHDRIAALPALTTVGHLSDEPNGQ